MLDIIEEYASVCKANPLNKQKETKTIIPGQKINVNGYGYVDLKLPSGTLWATCNVGASKPSDYGKYFQWGDIIGYSKEQIGKGKQFNLNDYKFSIDGSNLNFSKYKNDGDTLELEDDAAHIIMGGDWHIPTPAQFKELINETTSEWIEQNGVNGRLFTSKKDPSKTIFIPAAGYACGGSVQYSGAEADVWSSMLFAFDAGSGQYLSFNSGYANLYGGSRCCGFSVRGVVG